MRDHRRRDDVVPVTRTWVNEGRNTRKPSAITCCKFGRRDRLLSAGNCRRSGIYTVPSSSCTSRARSRERLMGVLAPERGVDEEIGDATLFLAGVDPTGIRVLDGIRHRRRAGAGFRRHGRRAPGVSVPVTLIASSAPRRTAFAVDLVIKFGHAAPAVPTFAESTHVPLISPPDPAPVSTRGVFTGCGAAVGPNGFTVIGAYCNQSRLSGGLGRRRRERCSNRKSAFGDGFLPPVGCVSARLSATH